MRRVAAFMNVPDDVDDHEVATIIECALNGDGWDTDPTVYSRDEDIVADLDAGEESTGHFAAHATRHA